MWMICYDWQHLPNHTNDNSCIAFRTTKQRADYAIFCILSSFGQIRKVIKFDVPQDGLDYYLWHDRFNHGYPK